MSSHPQLAEGSDASWLHMSLHQERLAKEGAPTGISHSLQTRGKDETMHLFALFSRHWPGCHMHEAHVKGWGDSTPPTAMATREGTHRDRLSTGAANKLTE